MFRLPNALLLLTFVASAYSQTTGFNPKEICSNVPDNTKIKDPTACNKYVTCVNKNPIAATCPAGLSYDRNKRNCAPSNTVQCGSSDPCPVNANGFVADPYNCSNYYYCQNGKGVLGECPAGMNYNPLATNCMQGYECTARNVTTDYCDIVPDGVFIKVPNKCQSYQLCWNGKLSEGNCPTGYNFNAVLGACDSSPNLNCNDSGKPGPSNNSKCTQANVFISDGVSCDGYFYCEAQQDGSIVPKHGNCKFLYFFDARTRSCTIRSNVACNNDPCVGLGYYGIQLSNKANDGCTGYLICQNGKTIGQSQCPNAQYFNENDQMCSTNQVSFPACAP